MHQSIHIDVQDMQLHIQSSTNVESRRYHHRSYIEDKAASHALASSFLYGGSQALHLQPYSHLPFQTIYLDRPITNGRESYSHEALPCRQFCAAQPQAKKRQKTCPMDFLEPPK